MPNEQWWCSGYITIGDYQISHITEMLGKVWISKSDGEGGSFDTHLLELAIKAFYDEHF